MPTKKKPSKKYNRNDDLYTVKVGTAGIGGGGFRAYFEDDRIDRSDGDDLHTYESPGEALAALGKKLDEVLVREAWFWRSERDSGPESSAKKNKKVKRTVIKELYEEEERL